jgi:hypothetical protein
MKEEEELTKKEKYMKIITSITGGINYSDDLDIVLNEIRENMNDIFTDTKYNDWTKIKINVIPNDTNWEFTEISEPIIVNLGGSNYYTN